MSMVLLDKFWIKFYYDLLECCCPFCFCCAVCLKHPFSSKSELVVIMQISFVSHSAWLSSKSELVVIMRISFISHSAWL